MKSKIFLFIGLVWLAVAGCKNTENEELYLDSFDTKKYYTQEVFPDSLLPLYGKWKLYKVSGGFCGCGHDPEYDYLELKSFGIYGIIRNDTLLEFGKLAPGIFDQISDDYFQVKFEPEFYTGKNPIISPAEKYMHLHGKDSLDVISPCCDLYNYHFRRVR
jgi:hypothetical protein